MMHNFFSSVLWFSIGLVLNRIKYIILSIIILRLGITYLAVFYITIFLVNEFSSFGHRIVSSGYNRFLRDNTYISVGQNLHNLINSSLQISLFTGVVSMLATLLLAYPIGMLFRDYQFTQTIKIFALALPFLLINHQIIKILSLLGKYKETVAFHNFVEAAIVMAAAYLGIFIFNSSLNTVLILQVGAIILTSILGSILLRILIPEFRFSFHLLKVRPKISETIIDNALFIMILNLIDSLIIGYFLGARMLGIYIAMQVGPRLIYEISTSVFSMFLHKAASLSHDSKKVSAFSKKVFRYILIFASPMVLLLILYPQEALYNILKIHLQVDILPMQLLALAFFVKLIAWMGSQVLILSKSSSENMKMNMFLAVIAVPMLLFLTPIYGFSGVAFAILLLSLTEAIGKITLIYKKSNISFLSYASLKVLVISLLIFIFVRFLFKVNFMMFLLYFPFVFFLSLIVFKCLDKKDLLLFTKRLRNDIDTEEENKGMI